MKYTYLILLIILSSCSLQKRLDKYCPLCVQESKTETVIQYRDTTIKIPGETVTIVDSLYCDSLGNVLSRLHNTIKDKNGKIIQLQTQLNNNVYTSKAKVDTLYKTIKGNTVVKEVIKYRKGKDVKVKYTPWYMTFLSVIGGITLFIIALIVIIKLIKKQPLL